MNSTLVQLTLRRWAEITGNPRFYVFIIGFILIGTVIGPFGMREGLSFQDRFFLSIVANISAWFLGLGLAVPIRYALGLRGFSVSVSLIIACLIAMIFILPAIYGLVFVYTGAEISMERISDFGIIMAVLAVFTVFALQNRRAFQLEIDAGIEPARNGPEPDSRRPDVCWLQRKLPEEKRGVMYALVAQDHYVEFITDKGSQLVLMRFSDAVELAKPDCGVKVHRSAWVSKYGIHDVRKDGRKILVTLPNGRDISVSRDRKKRVLDFANSSAELPLGGVFSLS